MLTCFKNNQILYTPGKLVQHPRPLLLSLVAVYAVKLHKIHKSLGFEHAVSLTYCTQCRVAPDHTRSPTIDNQLLFCICARVTSHRTERRPPILAEPQDKAIAAVGGVAEDVGTRGVDLIAVFAVKNKNSTDKNIKCFIFACNFTPPATHSGGASGQGDPLGDRISRWRCKRCRHTYGQSHCCLAIKN